MQQDQTTTAKLIKRFRSFRYSLVLQGIAVGLFLSAHPWAVSLWMLALLGIAALVTLLLRVEPFISGSGIPQVEGEMQGGLSQTWWRVLLAKFIGGILTIGAGLSLGRDGQD